MNVFSRYLEYKVLTLYIVQRMELGLEYFFNVFLKIGHLGLVAS